MSAIPHTSKSKDAQAASGLYESDDHIPQNYESLYSMHPSLSSPSMSSSKSDSKARLNAAFHRFAGTVKQSFSTDMFPVEYPTTPRHLRDAKDYATISDSIERAMDILKGRLHQKTEYVHQLKGELDGKTRSIMALKEQKELALKRLEESERELRLAEEEMNNVRESRELYKRAHNDAIIENSILKRMTEPV